MGESVTLDTGVTGITTNDELLWTFGPDDTRIAQISETTKRNYKRFGDELTLDNKTGVLTIKKIAASHSGVYKLQIYNNGKTTHKKFRVTISGE